MKYILPFLFFLSLSPLYSQSLEFTPVTLTGPPLLAITDIGGAGDNSGRLFITEKRGAIRIVQNGVVLSQEFLSITNLVVNSGEKGLLGLAFHPQYPDSPYIYVNYVIVSTNTTRIARFTVPAATPNNADETSIMVLLDIPSNHTNHKAGDLMFGPDGYLYITTGDGGSFNDPDENGQNFMTRLGKILRININSKCAPNNYCIPPDNPYLPYTGTGDTLPEIWMNGARNPWRMSFDRETGDLWIADVGQDEYEEINMIPAGTGSGKNLGWDCREGFHWFEPGNCDTVAMPLTYPVLEYPHSCPPCPYGNGNSVTGGFVYRGTEYPDFIGKYVAVDYSSNDIFLIEQTGPNTFNIWGQNVNGNSAVTTFGEDDEGELYAGNLNGVLYSVTMGEPLPVQWIDLLATPITKGNKVQWTMNNMEGIDYFEIQRSLTADFIALTTLAQIQAIPDKNTYTYFDRNDLLHGVYYRIAAHMNDGSIEYSPMARIMPADITRPTLTYDFNTDLWRIYLPTYWQQGELILYDLQGRTVYQKTLTSNPLVDVAPPITPGIYFITIRNSEGSWSDRIVR